MHEQLQLCPANTEPRHPGLTFIAGAANACSAERPWFPSLLIAAHTERRYSGTAGATSPTNSDATVGSWFHVESYAADTEHRRPCTAESPGASHAIRSAMSTGLATTVFSNQLPGPELTRPSLRALGST